jgi:hypothetical protein
LKRVIAILFIGLGLPVLGQSGENPQKTTLIVKMANGLAQAQRKAAIERHGGTLQASISAELEVADSFEKLIFTHFRMVGTPPSCRKLKASLGSSAGLDGLFLPVKLGVPSDAQYPN